jgi:hypothetical protein
MLHRLLKYLLLLSAEALLIWGLVVWMAELTDHLEYDPPTWFDILVLCAFPFVNTLWALLATKGKPWVRIICGITAGFILEIIFVLFLILINAINFYPREMAYVALVISPMPQLAFIEWMHLKKYVQVNLYE